MKPSVVAIIASFAASVYAHGGIYSYEIDGVTYPGYIQSFFLEPTLTTILATNGKNQQITKRTSSNGVGTSGQSKTFSRPT
jgi:hypothetical protein